MDDNEYYEMFWTAFKYYLKHNWDDGQKRFAADVGVSEATISGVKKRKAIASLKVQADIAKVLGFNYDDFLKQGRCIIETGYPCQDVIIKQKHLNNNVIDFPEKYKHPDLRYKTMQDNLQAIYEHGDHSLISAIEMNLVSFRKTVEMEKRISKLEMQNEKSESENLSLKEENETLKKMVRNPGG
jgi:transcriptional regulator with XRE-family HTH domain